MKTNAEDAQVKTNAEDAQVKTTAEDGQAKTKDDQVKERLDRFFSPLAEAYIEICDGQKRQFYGLRDFYRYAIFHTSLLQLHLLLRFLKFGKDALLDV